ncbi:unnamed protein product [Discosporangium mesarthrocarpum]
MTKHVQNKGTKKHSRPSDIHRTPIVYAEEVMTNGNFPGAPPIFEVLEEGTGEPYVHPLVDPASSEPEGEVEEAELEVVLGETLVKVAAPVEPEPVLA